MEGSTLPRVTETQMSEKENINLQLQGSQINLYERPRNMSGRASTRSMSVKKFRPKRPMSAMPALGNQVNITINDLRDCRRPQSADNPCHTDVDSCLSSSQQTLENETASEVCGEPFVGHKSKLAAKFSMCRKSLEIQDVKVVNINIETVMPTADCFNMESKDLTDEESLGEQIMALAQNNSTSQSSVISQVELQKQNEFHSEWSHCEENSAALIISQPEDTLSAAKQSDVIDTSSKVPEQENEISIEVKSSTFCAELEETSKFNTTDSQEIQKDSSLKEQYSCPVVENGAKSLDYSDENLPFHQESSLNELPAHVLEKHSHENLSCGSEMSRHQEHNHARGKILPLDIEEEDGHLVYDHFEYGNVHTNAWIHAEDFSKSYKSYTPRIRNVEEKINEFTVGNLDTDDRQLESKMFSYNKQSGSCTNKTSGKLKDILTFLSEAEDSVNDSQEHIVVSKLMTTKSSACAYELNFKAIPRLEELKDLSTMELAHQVLTLQLQLEDREHSLDLMRHTLAEQRELALSSSQRMEKDLKARLHEHKKEYEIIISRHQKFIDQLINEKKSLTEKCESLVKELKASEDRHQSNLKASEERHKIELQKAREMHAAAEKLRRERWIDQKTKKIKEMTVKGLEPELQRMAARHQQELSDLRSLHKQELEELEMRAARKSNQQVEKVREEMELQQRELLEREREAQRERFDKQIEEIEKSHQDQRQRLLTEVCREKESLAEKEANIRREVEDYKMQLQKSKIKEVDSMKKEYEEAANNMARKYQNELKALHEAYEEEKEIWVHNFKKEQNAQLYERESEIRDHYKRERDREIELIIHRFEEENSRAKLEQEQVTENRIKRMQEKFSAEMKDLEASEQAYKDKWNETKCKLTETEDEIIALRAAIRQLESEITEAHKITDRLSAERANMKEVIRDEFCSQISDMEREILRLREVMSEMKANHQMELTLKERELEMARAEKEKELHEVYDRVKCTINKKHKTIQQLKIQNQSVLERCEHLEQLLEQQRRDYLLK